MYGMTVNILADPSDLSWLTADLATIINGTARYIAWAAVSDMLVVRPDLVRAVLPFLHALMLNYCKGPTVLPTGDGLLMVRQSNCL